MFYNLCLHVYEFLVECTYNLLYHSISSQLMFMYKQIHHLAHNRLSQRVFSKMYSLMYLPEFMLFKRAQLWAYTW